jgi:hypothetical protein
MWIPPVPKSELLVIISSFAAVFEHTSLWTAPDVRGFYCIGEMSVHEIDSEKVTSYLNRQEVQKDLGEYGFTCQTSEELLSLRILDEQAVRKLVDSVPVMTDDWPYTEFPLWRRLFQPNGRELYRSDDLIRDLSAEDL